MNVEPELPASEAPVAEPSTPESEAPAAAPRPARRRRVSAAASTSAAAESAAPDASAPAGGQAEGETVAPVKRRRRKVELKPPGEASPDSSPAEAAGEPEAPRAGAEPVAAGAESVASIPFEPARAAAPTTAATAQPTPAWAMETAPAAAAARASTVEAPTLQAQPAVPPATAASTPAASSPATSPALQTAAAGAGTAPREPASTLEPQAREGTATRPQEMPPDATPTPRFEGRRGRRDRRRSGRSELPPGAVERRVESVDEDDDNGAGEVDATPRPAPIAPEELFAQVLEGSFDREAEPAGGPEGQAEPPRRILPPDPDAPKLHKVLAQAGIGSRRDMEQLIADGAITVNGQPAHTGQRISFGDRIAVEGKPVKVRIAPPAPRILAYHKPAGEVVTNDDPQQRPTVFRKLPRLPHGKWQSVGRLDINTEGLLLFTNSGDLAHRLMHPRFGVEREYAVRILGKLDEDQKDELLDGVEVDGQEAKFVSITDGGGEGANHWYRVVITEGRNREVRKLFEAIGLTVSRLIRIRYGSVVLPRGLKRGVWVDLDAEDVKAIRRLAGGDLQRPGEGPGGQPKRGPQPDRGPRRERDRLPQQGQPPQGERGPDEDEEDDFDPSRIPNPLEQTFDRRFVGKRGGFSGFGNPNSNRGAAGGGRKGGSANAPPQPDPMQTSIGYIGADAFHRNKGPRGGGGGRGGGRNRRGR